MKKLNIPRLCTGYTLKEKRIKKIVAEDLEKKEQGETPLEHRKTGFYELKQYCSLKTNYEMALLGI